MQKNGVMVAVALKVALVGLLAVAVVFPDLPQFEGKAMAWRAATYPIATLIVPAGWWISGRRIAYPWAIDALIVLPFLVDVAGNALDLYDSIWWWDDANHFFNWSFLAAGFALAMRPARLATWNAVLLAIGFGAATAIAWELLEYVAFIRDSPELETAYTDTLGDLALGTLGSIAAAIAVAVTGRRKG